MKAPVSLAPEIGVYTGVEATLGFVLAHLRARGDAESISALVSYDCVLAGKVV